MCSPLVGWRFGRYSTAIELHSLSRLRQLLMSHHLGALAPWCSGSSAEIAAHLPCSQENLRSWTAPHHSHYPVSGTSPPWFQGVADMAKKVSFPSSTLSSCVIRLASSWPSPHPTLERVEALITVVQALKPPGSWPTVAGTWELKTYKYSIWPLQRARIACSSPCISPLLRDPRPPTPISHVS